MIPTASWTTTGGTGWNIDACVKCPKMETSRFTSPRDPSTFSEGVWDGFGGSRCLSEKVLGLLGIHQRHFATASGAYGVFHT